MGGQSSIPVGRVGTMAAVNSRGKNRLEKRSSRRVWCTFGRHFLSSASARCVVAHVRLRWRRRCRLVAVGENFLFSSLNWQLGRRKGVVLASAPLHTHRTQRLVWVPWCDSRNRLEKHGGRLSALGLVDTRLLSSWTIERPVDGQSGLLGDIRPACSCAHVIPAGKQLSGAVVLAVWRMKATYRQMWALEAGGVERDLECVSMPTLTNAGRPSGRRALCLASELEERKLGSSLAHGLEERCLEAAWRVVSKSDTW